ncbi:MAG: substrate-binding domain-containing protein [Eubacteriales bacterium]|nr:substrate-binding domain-containing protein [Eubacteriales bacterium]
MKKKLVSMLLCVTMVSAMVMGCGSSSEEKTEEPAEETQEETEDEAENDGELTLFEQALAQVDEDFAPLPAKDSGVKLAAIESTLANSFWVTMQEGYEDAAAEYGVEIDVQATDSDTDTEGQLNILENMLIKDYAAIAVSPLTGDCLISGIVNANNEEVPIITTGNEVDAEALKAAGGTLAGMITVDFKSQGEMGAQYIVDNNKSDSKKVAIIAGNEGGTQADARRDGAKEAFEAAGYEVVAVEQCDFDVQKAYDAAAAIMEKNPDLAGFACGNDDMALGVVKALQEKDLKDQVMVVGVDFTEEAKEAIAEGTYDATVAMSPYLMGREAVIMMLKALEGQEVSSIGDSTPMALVNADNVAQMSDWH